MTATIIGTLLLLALTVALGALLVGAWRDAERIGRASGRDCAPLLS